MYDRKKIEDAFMGLVGLPQSDNPDFEKITEILTYNGDNVLIRHPLINIENIDMTSRNYDQFMFQAYDGVTNYYKGDRVSFNGKNYESREGDNSNPNVGNDPDINPVDWSPISLLSLYLEGIFRSSIQDLVNSVFMKKKLNRQTKTLLQNQRLSTTVGGFNDQVVNTGALVGVEFKLKHIVNIMAVIEMVGVQLSGACDFNLYVYHSSQIEPIMVVPINHVKTGSLEWHKTDIRIHHLSNEYDAGGVFYLMYDQNELGSVQAIKKRQNFHISPCSYCNKMEVNYFNLYTKYLYIRTVKVNLINRNGVNIWDLSKTEYESDNNFGLNFEWTVKCDLSDFIIRQKEVFSFALRDMVIKNLLENMSNSTRQNGLDEKVRTMARAELQSKQVGGMGFGNMVEKQIEAVDFEISNLDSTCMPCNNKTGMQIHSVGLSRNG